GKVRLDQPVRDLMAPMAPARPPWRPITLLDLATGRSSLAQWPDDLPGGRGGTRNDYTISDLLQYARHRGVIKPPGDRYQDSHLGMALLGQLLADREGESYEDLMQEAITGPLGMHDTAIALSDEQRGRLIQGHPGDRPPSKGLRYSAFSAAVGLHSTA